MSTRADDLFEESDLLALKKETKRDANNITSHITSFRSDVRREKDLKVNNNSQPSELLLQQQQYQVGDLLVSYLEQIGVEYVFGIPGGPIEPFYNALARSERRGCATFPSGLADQVTRRARRGVRCASDSGSTRQS